MSDTPPVADGQARKSEHPASSPMDAEIRTVARLLKQELLKDLPFFGTCGVAVGWLMLVQYRLTQTGMGPKDSLADALFSDFVSFNAFGLVFLGLLALGSAVTCLAALNIHWPRLERVVDHLQTRLAQLASSIISFTLGLSLTALCHSLLTITAGGVGLFSMIALFDGMLVVGFGSAMLVARRRSPFDQWWVGVMFLVLALGATLSLIFWGVK
ncbi:hypothetical protein [Roseateles sp. LKC17W]|uniref:Uncharacterized protein n=1 Tax=Pelomonas margarita TaxID=3299031 RepID=A0ABW7FQF1_9BURK